MSLEMDVSDYYHNLYSSKRCWNFEQDNLLQKCSLTHNGWSLKDFDKIASKIDKTALAYKPRI